MIAFLLPSRSAAARRLGRSARLLLLAAPLAACASVGPPTTETSPPQGRGTPAPETPVPGRGAPGAEAAWPIKTREHVDLWLHGYAMLSDDTAQVPLFRRGYRDAMAQRRRQANVTTGLDANRATLRERLATNPALVNGQFVPLYFGSWDELRQGANTFLQANGEPRRASSQPVAQVIAFFASVFPTAADREWLRLYLVALEDERNAFYRAHWAAEQQERLATYAAVDTLWRRQLLPRLRGFLTNTQQTNGDVMLSLPLGGEGRTVGGRRTENVVAVTFPESPAAAAEALYVFAHEVVGSLAQQAVTDNVTPAEAREGAADRLQSPAAVHGGLLLLQRVAPEHAAGYARYYLRVAGAAGGADPVAALQRTYPVPAAIRDAMARQIELVLGGI